MWSFGILLWELNTREVPFADLSPMECGMKVSKRYRSRFSVSSTFSKIGVLMMYRVQIALEGLRVQIPPGIARNMGRLMNICLNEDPGRRPNFDQIIPILEKMS